MQVSVGFVLSYVKYGDHDAVIHCFTNDFGYQTYFAKGIYAAKNKKKAYLLPLNEIQIYCKESSKNKGIENISRIELVKNRSLYTDVKSNAMIFFIADFLNQILKQENRNEEIYLEIGHFLDQIEGKNYRAHLFFLYFLLEILGFSPLNSAGQFLNPEQGIFEKEESNPLFNKEISLLWKEIAVEKKYSVKINSGIRKDFQNSLLLYYRYHYDEFREPKSLEILQQIFE